MIASGLKQSKGYVFVWITDECRIPFYHQPVYSKCEDRTEHLFTCWGNENQRSEITLVSIDWLLYNIDKKKKSRSALLRAGNLFVTSWKPWPHGLVTDFDQQSQYRLRLPHHQIPFVGLSFIHSFILKRARLNSPFLDWTILCFYMCQSLSYPKK